METKKVIYVVEEVTLMSTTIVDAKVLHVYDSISKAADFVDEIERRAKSEEGTFTALGGDRYEVKRNMEGVMVQKVYYVKRMSLE